MICQVMKSDVCEKPGFLKSSHTYLSLSMMVLNSRDRPKKTMAPIIYALLKFMVGYTLCVKTT